MKVRGRKLIRISQTNSVKTDYKIGQSLIVCYEKSLHMTINTDGFLRFYEQLDSFFVKNGLLKYYLVFSFDYSILKGHLWQKNYLIVRKPQKSIVSVVKCNDFFAKYYPALTYLSINFDCILRTDRHKLWPIINILHISDLTIFLVFFFKISTFYYVLEKYLVEAVHESVIIASNLIDQSGSGEISTCLSELGHFFQGENCHRANVVSF